MEVVLIPCLQVKEEEEALAHPECSSRVMLVVVLAAVRFGQLQR